jgi:hypothetical protein
MATGKQLKIHFSRDLIRCATHSMVAAQSEQLNKKRVCRPHLRNQHSFVSTNTL